VTASIDQDQPVIVAQRRGVAELAPHLQAHQGAMRSTNGAPTPSTS
jgi:hypothetical protein